MDWLEWHSSYEQKPALARRLKLVQAHIWRCVDACPAGAINITSLCSGDGRDLFNVMKDHPRRKDIRALLVEIHPELVEAGRAAYGAAGLSDNVTFINDDAAVVSPYLGRSRADIVMMCGMLGLIRQSEVPKTVHTMRALCREGGHVVWTRRLDNNGLIYFRLFSRLLKSEGFRSSQVSFTSLWLPFFRPKKPLFAVSTHRFTGSPVPLPEQGRLFEVENALVG